MRSFSPSVWVLVLEIDGFQRSRAAVNGHLVVKLFWEIVTSGIRHRATGRRARSGGPAVRPSQDSAAQGSLSPFLFGPCLTGGLKGPRRLAWLFGSLALLTLLTNGTALLAADANPGEFTIATYNVLHQNRNLPRLATTIRELGADFVALQETNPESERWLRRELGHWFPHVAFREGRSGSDGFGFLSKVPLRRLMFLDPLPGWRGVWLAEVSLGGTNVQVVNVHLATPQVGRVDSLKRLLAAFAQCEALHTREMARLRPHLASRMPVVVLGDFNSFSFSHAATFLRQRGWVDSFAAVTDHADRQGTWDVQYQDSRWSFRIDFVFHTPDLRTLASRIVQSAASDHDPVVSRLQVRP